MRDTRLLFAMLILGFTGCHDLSDRQTTDQQKNFWDWRNTTAQQQETPVADRQVDLLRQQNRK